MRSREMPRPPPLPHAGEWGAAQSSSSASVADVFDAIVPPPLDAGRGAVGLVRPLPLAWLWRLVAQSLAVAVPAGLLFGLAMGLVRSIDAERFATLLRGMTPMALGGAAFLLLFTIQMLAGLAHRGR